MTSLELRTRSDDELVLGLLEAHRLAVDGDLARGEPAEIEVELLEILRGDEVDRRNAVEVALERRRVGCRGRVVEVEVVVQHVGAAVAGEREVWIARSSGTLPVSRRGRVARSGDGERRAGEDRERDARRSDGQECGATTWHGSSSV
jgi:hypothetical protein